jgi:succinyl-diaminopimelate desuccinylase
VLTAGEEIGCAGAHVVVRTPDTLGRVGALVVGEPTNLRPRVGHRGVLWVRLRFAGRTAHASMPHEGDNAVLKAARAAILLDGHDFGVVHPALGWPTLNVGRLEGGLNLNSVPDSAVLGIDLRLVPGQSSGAVLAELARLLPGAALEPVVDCPPLWSDPGGAWLQLVAERAAALTDRPAGGTGPVPFATDAGYLTPAYRDPPTVILGPGATEEAHKTDEWCSTTRIEQAVELYADLAAAWCSEPLSRA